MEKTILVVDDVDEVREMCAHYLAHEGFRVAVASDGQEAVDKASRILPTLVLMDLSLPVLGGLEATKRIKGDPRTQHIPVILMTAQTRSGSAAVIETGCEGFLVKPAAPKEIVAEIERVLKRAQSGT
jgi:CheY-like chemotaxis protein